MLETTSICKVVSLFSNEQETFQAAQFAKSRA